MTMTMTMINKCSSVLFLILFSSLARAQIGTCHVKKGTYPLAPTKTQFIYAKFGGQIQVAQAVLHVPPNALKVDQLVTLSVFPIEEQTKKIMEKLNIIGRYRVVVKAARSDYFSSPVELSYKKHFNCPYYIDKYKENGMPSFSFMSANDNQREISLKLYKTAFLYME